MRNIAEYPIDKEECLEAIDNTIEHLQSLMLLGDTRGYCMTLIKRYLEDNIEDFHDFLYEQRLG